MESSKFASLPVIDCHVHLWKLGNVLDEKALDKFLNEETLEKQGEALIETIAKGKLKQMYIFDGRKHGSLYLKAKCPGYFYAGGFAPWSGQTSLLPDVNWPRYINSLIELGYDGIGEMGTKPVTRDKHVPLDSSYYKGFWENCEKLNFPVLCHVGDVEDFWHENLTPDWAKKRGWGYWKGDYPTMQEFYGEMENVLGRHPKLKVVFCHFYFLSPNLEKASEFLDNYRNANIDLTPGIELVYNISRRHEDWRDFFIKNDTRIFLGTDTGMSTKLQEHLDRIWLLRTFLETDKEFYTPATADDLLTRYKEPYIGLKLPRASLEKIYSKNFQNLWGQKPAKINTEAAASACEKEGNAQMAKMFREIL